MPDLQENSSRQKAALEVSALILLAIAFLTVSLIIQNPFAKNADPVKSIGTIIAAGLTLIMYSFLYRDNPLFKIAENLYVGVTLGYTLITLCWQQALRPEVFDPLYNAPTGGAFFYELLNRAAPILLGILLLTRLSRKYGWLSRYSYALMVGWGSGMAIPVVTNTYIFKQLYASITPFKEVTKGVSGLAWFSNDWFMKEAFPIFGAIFILVGTVAVLFYFFFSVEHKRATGAISKIGIWFLMVSFGASFGYTVMARVSLLIGRVQFLLFEWLKIPQ